MWKKAVVANIDELTDIFWNNVIVHPGYISHGEIQMGVAEDYNKPSPNGREKWERYIRNKIESPSTQLPSVVLVNIHEDAINAFCVLELSEDGDKPYGVICDMIVREECRGNGVGKEMFSYILNWFKENGIDDIYLESGIDNHKAHKFFQKLGFSPISHIFKLQK